MIRTTALDLIKLSMKLSGVLAIGQTAQSEDVTDIFQLLNSMLAQWNQNRWLVWHLVDLHCFATGAQSYTVGPGGDIDGLRPDRLQSAYVRQLHQTQTPSQSGNVDFPLNVMETHEEYGAISLKELRSFPSICFYDSTMPLGTLYVWPIPSSNFEIHIIIKDQLQSFDTLTTVFAMPPEYYEALLYNLAGRIQILYQLPVNPGVIALAKGALNTIRVANHRVANLMMPAGLSRHGGWAMHGVGGVTEGTFQLDESVLGPA